MQGLSTWRATPPAVFPPLMGMLGLGLVWLRAAPELGAPLAVGWVIFGTALVIYLGLLAVYAARVLAHPDALAADLATVPGRMGVAALTLCAMLAAAGLIRLAPGVGGAILWGALLGHAALALNFALVLARTPKEQRYITPVWHLVFVGFIVGAQGTALLGLAGLTTLIYGATLVAALAIYAGTWRQLGNVSLPPPLRPAWTIHLAPLSLLGTVALMLGFELQALALGGLAVLVFAALLARLPWMMAAGFAPSWAAFTFPVVAFAGLLVMLGGQIGVLAWLGLGVLLGATIYVPMLLALILRLWWAGRLAPPPAR